MGAWLKPTMGQPTAGVGWECAADSSGLVVTCLCCSDAYTVFPEISFSFEMK